MINDVWMRRRAEVKTGRGGLFIPADLLRGRVWSFLRQGLQGNVILAELFCINVWSFLGKRSFPNTRLACTWFLVTTGITEDCQEGGLIFLDSQGPTLAPHAQHVSWFLPL